MDDLILTVRVRCTLPDPFAGLKGHAYIAARGLSPMIGGSTLRLVGDCECAPCVQQRLLPTVQAIIASWPIEENPHAAAH